MKQKTAIIIGAGPAGLTAAYELVNRTNIKPIVYEMSDDIGGICKTVDYKGNKIDIGGHRFFSKSDRIMRWWKNIIPLQNNIDPEKIDKVMLIRNRLSRIFFLRKFFDYPISLNFNTLSNLGLKRTIKIGLSYIKNRLFPIKKEKSLEDFFINRFGKELYLTFFKDYTEKLWGVKCNQIKPEWGAQRIKGLSITAAIKHAVKNVFSKESSLSQKKTETSLIGKFMYPKFGPGQLWEEVARVIKEKGGEIYKNHKVVGVNYIKGKVIEVNVKNEKTGEIKTQKGDYFFSTMPVKELIQAFGENVPKDVSKVAKGLIYRDFITVGLLLKKLKINNNQLIPDNWIYVQERDVKIGRIQVFNNWSPYLVKDQNNIWLGLEYFCNEGDELWSKTDTEFSKFAINELANIYFIDKGDVIDSTVIRMPKTYPAYFGSYDKFKIIRNFTDDFENLFLIGRNGMHRYNNSDHSMLAAIVAVDNIINNRKDKSNIWEVNTEEEYHEEKKL
jgi:protoporphyrinogen oxidase